MFKIFFQALENISMNKNTCFCPHGTYILVDRADNEQNIVYSMLNDDEFYGRK